MKLKTVLLSFVLIDFLALTIWATWSVGLEGFVEAASHNPGSVVLAVDLVIALTMVCVWMVKDARQRGVAAWPFVVMTALTGSAGPLLYLVLRSRKEGAGETSTAPLNAPAEAAR